MPASAPPDPIRTGIIDTGPAPVKAKGRRQSSDGTRRKDKVTKHSAK